MSTLTADSDFLRGPGGGNSDESRTVRSCGGCTSNRGGEGLGLQSQAALLLA